MEGDAGASQLNPPPMSMIRRLHRRQPRIREESDAAADQISTEVKAEESPASEDEADASEAAVERGLSRVGRGWLAGNAAALLLLAGGVGIGGYFALRSHQESLAMARNNGAVIEAAKLCIAATQAPDTSAMAASEQKIIECGTGEFRTQVLLYTSILVQAYQAANVHLQVSDVRAAVERNNTDGSVDVLVAMRIKMSPDQTENKEIGYRLRVRMTPVDGPYKISKLDQVTK